MCQACWALLIESLSGSKLNNAYIYLYLLAVLLIMYLSGAVVTAFFQPGCGL